MTEETWRTIPDFTDYKISNLGRVFNLRTERVMRTSRTNHGHIKITLTADWPRERFTRSVAYLVAEAFLGPPPHEHFDAVILLDGDLTNVEVSNLTWRPTNFAYRYTRQIKTRQPRPYENLPVINVETGVQYESIVHAGMSEGLLFSDIWRSTYSGEPVFPTGSIFEINGRYEE